MRVREEKRPGRCKRDWRHPSVHALQETYGGRLSPEQSVRKRAGEIIEYARRLEWKGPPYNPRVLASLLGIKVEVRDLDPRTDGVLCVNCNGNLEILVNAGAPVARQNFTIFHEIAHTFFPDHFEIVRKRQSAGKVEEHHWELEMLCNLGASELLMPMDKFARDVVYHGFSLRSVDALKERYEASAEAVIRRMVATELEICCSVFFKRMLKPSERTQKSTRVQSPPWEKMRVDYVVPSEDFPCFIPRYKSPPADSCVNHALLCSGVICETEKWDLASHVPQFRVEAQAYRTLTGDSNRDCRVTALFFPAYF
ncbi:MAG: ImmA/IrrE family metallo-endopeptidase [Deltaproteobacteria bacterium]|nr:MAG: ImmA/IrrE family metallo-endopeptidase [Deltaproteobacteria bacterium]